MEQMFLLDKREWIKVKEKLPDPADIVEVLFYPELDRGFVYSDAYFLRGNWYVWNGHAYEAKSTEKIKYWRHRSANAH